MPRKWVGAGEAKTRNAEIRRLRTEEGATLGQLAIAFDLSLERIRQICNGIDTNARRQDPAVIEEMANRPPPIPDVYHDLPETKSKQKSGVAGIDLEVLETLARIQCTQGEAAAVLRVSEATLSRALNRPRIREVWERGREGGRVSLRRHMWAAAQGTKDKNNNTTYTSANVSSQQWLAKQDSWLGWTDKVVRDERHSGSIRHFHEKIPDDKALEELSDEQLSRLAGEAVGTPTRH